MYGYTGLGDCTKYGGEFVSWVRLYWAEGWQQLIPILGSLSYGNKCTSPSRIYISRLNHRRASVWKTRSIVSETSRHWQPSRDNLWKRYWLPSRKICKSTDECLLEVVTVYLCRNYDVTFCKVQYVVDGNCSARKSPSALKMPNTPLQSQCSIDLKAHIHVQCDVY